MAKEEDIFTGTLKKVFLAGVGAVAATADKSEEIFNDLVEKGETTIERGRSMNKELKHTVKERMKSDKETAQKSDNPIRDLNAILAGMTAEQLDSLKGKIDEAEEKVKGKTETETSEEKVTEEKDS